MDLPEPDDRLNSWKEIAAFLGRTVRTMQRWEKTQGLPLRRGGPGQRGAVVASKREIGEWWERRRSSLQDESSSDPPSDPSNLDPLPPAATERSRLWIERAVLTASIGAVAAATLFAVLFQRHNDPVTENAPRTGRLFAAATSEGQTLRGIPVGGLLGGVTLTPSGTVAYVPVDDQGTVAVVDLRAGHVVDRLPVVDHPQKVVLTRDGRRLIIAGRSELGVFDLDQRALTRFLPGAGAIRDVHLSRDDRYVWITLAQEGLKVLDVLTGAWDTVSTIGCPINLAAGPRSRRVFVSFQCGGPGGGWGRDAIGIIDEVTRSSIASRAGPPLVGAPIAVSPDEEHVWVDTADACLSPDYDHTGCPPGVGPVLHALRATTLEPLLTIRIPASKFGSTPIFFPDGDRLVISGTGLRVVDRMLGTIQESVDRNFGTGAFSADGRRFVVVDHSTQSLLVFEVAPASETKALSEISTHWTGDGAANDVVGGTHALTAEGVRFEAGRYGQAFAFDAASSGVNFGRRLNADVVTGKTMTYAGWVKPRRFGTPLHIASRTGVLGWRWFLTQEGRLAFCYLHTTPGLSCADGGIMGTTKLQEDRWTHVALVRLDSEISLFIDGRQDASMTVKPGFEPAPSPWADSELRLGAGPGGTAPFQGRIDEVLLFNRTLSAGELSQIMRATTFNDVTSITRR